MSIYTPDRWILIEVTTTDGSKITKVVASWYGGFTGSDSWKISSGTTKTIDRKTHWEFQQHSGSTYLCNKDSFGMSSYTRGVLEHYRKELIKAGYYPLIILEEKNIHETT